MTAGVPEAAHGVDAATVMGLLACRPRLLALGEPTHGEDVLLELRNDLFRQFVEQQGYRTIALESDCLRGLTVDDHIASAPAASTTSWSAASATSGVPSPVIASWCAGCAPTTTADPRPSGSASPASTVRWRSPAPRDKSTMRMAGSPVTWWSAGAIVSARLGEQYAFLATALGTISHQGVDERPPDTVEAMLYALPQQRQLVDARRLAATLADATPAPRVSPWYGYAPLDPAHLTSIDGLVFVKDCRRS